MSSRNTRSFMFSTLVIGGFAIAFTLAAGVRPFEFWAKFESNAQEILMMESQYAALQKKYQELRREFFNLEQRHNELLAKVESREEAEKNLTLTGSKEGRTLASIEYHVPTNLTVEGKYLLAFSHLKENRFLEAAKTFENFLSVPEGAAFQNSKTFYEAGVAWFKSNNYKEAHDYFVMAKDRVSGVEKAEMLRKIELWQLVLDSKTQSPKAHHSKKEGI
jgi:TolA-binding protein